MHCLLTRPHVPNSCLDGPGYYSRTLAAEYSPSWKGRAYGRGPVLEESYLGLLEKSYTPPPKKRTLNQMAQTIKRPIVARGGESSAAIVGRELFFRSHALGALAGLPVKA